MATYENSAYIFSSRKYYEVLCSGGIYSKIRKFPLPLLKQISLGSLQVNFETFPMNKNQGLNSPELCPVQ